MKKKYKVTIVSGGDEIRQRSYINHKIFALEHGFDYRLEIGLAEGVKTKFDYKLNSILHVLPLTEWVLWVDDDMYFTDFSSQSVEKLIDRMNKSDAYFAVAEGILEPNGFWSKINSGSMLIRNCEEAKTLLEDARNLSLSKVRDEWSDDEDGLFTGGDQDQLWYLIKNRNLEITGKVIIVDHSSLNSRGHYYSQSLTDNFSMHFCGYPDKALGAAQFARRFGVGQEIVPVYLLDKYGVTVRSPMGNLEYFIRLRKQRTVSGVKARLRPLKKKYFNKMVGN